MNAMGRTYGQDLWCVQKHLLLGGVHTAETLQKLYRESPEDPSIPVLEKCYKDTVDLRQDMWSKWGTKTKQEQHECDRCLEDLTTPDGATFVEVSNFVVDRDSGSLHAEVEYQRDSEEEVEKSLNSSESNDSISDQVYETENQIFGGMNKMANGRKFAGIGVKEAGMLALGMLGGQVASVGAEVWARNRDAGMMTPPAPTSNWFKFQNIIEGGLFGLLPITLGILAGYRKNWELPAFFLTTMGATAFTNAITRAIRENVTDPMSYWYQAPTTAMKAMPYHGESSRGRIPLRRGGVQPLVPVARRPQPSMRAAPAGAKKTAASEVSASAYNEIYNTNRNTDAAPYLNVQRF